MFYAILINPLLIIYKWSLSSQEFNLITCAVIISILSICARLFRLWCYKLHYKTKSVFISIYSNANLNLNFNDRYLFSCLLSIYICNANNAVCIQYNMYIHISFLGCSSMLSCGLNYFFCVSLNLKVSLYLV